MADTGWKNPTTAVNDDSMGVVAWNNPGNVLSSDNTYASIGSMTDLQELSLYLRVGGFGFNIPSGATIDGIEVRIERYNDYIYTYDYEVRIVKPDGSTSSENKSYTSPWESTEEYYYYGLPNDLWGETWSRSDINDADFGVVLSVQCYDASNGEIGNNAYVDNIQVCVYYTEPPPIVGEKYPLPPFRRSV